MSTAPEHVRLRRLRRAWELGLVAFVALLLSYSWPYSDRAVRQERVNLYAVDAFARGNLNLEQPIGEWGMLQGLAENDKGVAFSDGPIGPVLVALPMHAAATNMKDGSAWRVSELVDVQRTWTWLLLTLLGFFCLRRTLELKDLESAVVDVASLTWIAGTAAFYWAGIFASPGLTAVAAIVTLYCIARAEDRLGNMTEITKWCYFAGVAAGVLCLSDYLAIPVAGAFLVYLVVGDERLRTRGLMGFVVGVAPFLWGLAEYHAAAFGGALELPLFHLSEAHAVPRLDVPTMAGVWSQVFSPRGIVFMSPFVLLGLWGLWAMWEENRQRLAMLCAAATGFYILVAAGSPPSDWGPQGVVPALGLWFVPVAFGYQAACYHRISEALAKGLAVTSVIATQVIAAYVAVMPQTGHVWLDVADALRAENLVVPNLARTFGGAADASLGPLWLMAGLVAVVITARGMRSIGMTSRFAHVGGVVACLLVGATFWSVGGDDWSQADRDAYLQDVKRWDAREYVED